MYICVCREATDRDIREAILNGAAGMRDVRIDLGVSERCGVCVCHAKMVLDRVLQQADLTTALSEA